MIKMLSTQKSPSITLYVRKDKEKINHFDAIVARIPYDMNEEQLLAHFKRIGPVLKVIIYRNINGKSKGIAKVCFEKEKDRDRAIQNGKTLNFSDAKNPLFFHVFIPNLQSSSLPPE